MHTQRSLPDPLQVRIVVQLGIEAIRRHKVRRCAAELPCLFVHFFCKVEVEPLTCSAIATAVSLCDGSMSE